MRQLLVVIFLQLMMLASFAQQKTNQFDAQKLKQGPWSEQMPEIKGEPGYTWEGNYVTTSKKDCGRNMRNPVGLSQRKPINMVY